ncbi:MAG: hypothetical protein ABEH78_11340 [Haloferacaceae archaeon]
MDRSEKLPLLVALGVILLTAIAIYVFALPILCRIFTHAPTFC